MIEETGLTAGAMRPAAYTADVFEAEGLHYVTLFVVARDVVGEPTVREPAKCTRWEWFPWTTLPTPLFAPLRTLREQGYVPPGMA